jgi:hypothetical protein
VVADFPDRVEVTIESLARALPATGPRALRESTATKAGEGIGKPLEGDLAGCGKMANLGTRDLIERVLVL